MSIYVECSLTIPINSSDALLDDQTNILKESIVLIRSIQMIIIIRAVMNVILGFMKGFSLISPDSLGNEILNFLVPIFFDLIPASLMFRCIYVSKSNSRNEEIPLIEEIN
jgi:hypothetical protein